LNALPKITNELARIQTFKPMFTKPKLKSTIPLLLNTLSRL